MPRTPITDDEIRRARQSRPIRTSFDVASLHPFVRNTYLQSGGTAYPSTRAALRASNEAYRVAASDAAINQRSYMNTTGAVPPPDYGYIGPEHMLPGVRAQAEQYYSAQSKPDYRGPVTTYYSPTGRGSVALPTTTDPRKLAMRAAVYGNQPALPAASRFLGSTEPVSSGPVLGEESSLPAAARFGGYPAATAVTATAPRTYAGVASSLYNQIPPVSNPFELEKMIGYGKAAPSFLTNVATAPIRGLYSGASALANIFFNNYQRSRSVASRRPEELDYQGIH